MKVQLEIVMTLSLAEARILEKALATLPSDDPSDSIYQALTNELNRKEDSK